MTEHVTMRVRTPGGAYGIVSLSNGDPEPAIEIAVEGWARPATAAEREDVLELVLRVSSKIRTRAYKMLGRKPKR